MSSVEYKQTMIPMTAILYFVLGTPLLHRHWNVWTLTHWSRVTHICVGKLTIIGSDNGLSPGRRQAIIWSNAGILLIGPLGTNLSEFLFENRTFSLKKIRLKMSSAKCDSFRLGLNVLTETNESDLWFRLFQLFTLDVPGYLVRVCILQKLNLTNMHLWTCVVRAVSATG